MRSPVQSWVPLQESTAEMLCFFVYQTLKPCPVGGRHYCDSHRKLAFKVAVVVMDAVSEANDGLRVPQTKIAYGDARLSWVPCERTERIRRSRKAATETSWVPLQESTAFRCAFLFIYTLKRLEMFTCMLFLQKRAVNLDKSHKSIELLQKNACYLEKQYRAIVLL